MAATTTFWSPGRAEPAPGGPARGPLIIAAAACYLVMLPAYVQTSVPAALWCAVTGIAQLALAIAVLRAPSRFRLAAAAEVSGTMVVICLITRFAAGAVPKNMLWEPVDTAVGFTDIADLALQLVAAVMLTLAALRWPRRRARHRALVVTVTVLLMLPVVLLAAAGVTFATDGFDRVTAPAGAELTPRQVLAPGASVTLSYCTVDGVRLTMQVFEPPLSALRRHPGPPRQSSTCMAAA